MSEKKKTITRMYDTYDASPLIAPEKEAEQVCSLAEGSHYGLCQLNLFKHEGSHIKYPALLDAVKGKNSSQVPIQNLIGEGVIIELDGTEEKAISSDVLHFDEKIIFFKKTNFSSFFNMALAKKLIKKGVEVIGVHGRNFEKNSKELSEVFDFLLKENILIVEGLDLDNIPSGACKIYILPMKISDSGVLPARVMVQVHDEPHPKKQIFDLSTVISETTVVFPGDPIYCCHSDDAFALCNHAGTHIDYLAHIEQGGTTSADVGIEELCGPGWIIQVPDHHKTITAEFVQSLSISAGDFVFFKTRNSLALSKHEVFSEDYVFIEPDAAAVLVEKGIKVVGIDYISVDKYEEESLPTHQIFLKNNVLIVEGLEFGEMKEHMESQSNQLASFFVVAPLKLSNLDGLPARVVAEIDVLEKTKKPQRR